MEFEIKDNSAEVLSEFQQACERALEKCGLIGEGYAKKDCPVDTGLLRASITHKVTEGGTAVYVGTDKEYAAYVELGTGIHYTGGRPTPWVYQDANGNWHMTNGQRAQPYIKPAVADHADTYRGIIEGELKSG